MLRLRMIYKNFICCNLWFSKFSPLENQISPQGEIYPRLRTTQLEILAAYFSS